MKDLKYNAAIIMRRTPCRYSAASCAAALSTILLSTVANAEERTLAEKYGSLPTVSEAAISPDGQTIARLQYVGGTSAIAFIDLSGKEKPVGMDLTNAKGRALRWVGPEHAMLLVSGSTTVSWGRGLETHEVWRWYSIDRKAKKAAIPFRSYTQNTYFFAAGELKSINLNIPNSIVMAHGNPYSLYDVDLNSGNEKIRERGEKETDSWVVDASGNPTIRVDYDASREELQFFQRADDASRFKKSAIVANKREDDLIIFPSAPGPSKNLIVGLAMLDDFKALRTFDADTGSFTGEAVSAAGYDVSSAVVDPFSGMVIGVEFVDDFRRVRFFEGPLAAAQEKVERSMPGAAPVITSWSKDYSKFLVRVAYPDHPDQIFIYEPASMQLNMISPTYADIDGAVAAAKEKYDYVSPDGQIIPGYLTIPHGASPKNLPLIVMPHGGPAARDDRSFDWWAYYYAANGYLVYQPNFRGSAGYGKKFKEDGFLQWGLKMQDDVSNGVKKLIAEGVADKNRVCIVGASYGGYSALVGATLTPDLYACAVSVGGVSNLPAMISYQTDRGRVAEDAWDVRIGARVSDNAKLREVSPYYQASRATKPILLIHGDKDAVVPIDQSYAMKSALEDAGKDIELVVLKGEDHWLSSSVTRIEMLSRSIDFINRQIGGRP